MLPEKVVGSLGFICISNTPEVLGLPPMEDSVSDAVPAWELAEREDHDRCDACDRDRDRPGRAA